jgi:hypothetical protein
MHRNIQRIRTSFEIFGTQIAAQFRTVQQCLLGSFKENIDVYDLTCSPTWRLMCSPRSGISFLS